ncbi:MAG: Mov34/MPN/PAD-1 family protein [Pyrinomonadaceae bacterium]
MNEHEQDAKASETIKITAKPEAARGVAVPTAAPRATAQPNTSGSGWRLYRIKGEQHRPDDCEVVFSLSAYDKIVQHLSQDKTREHGGLLLGRFAPGPYSHEMAVWVEVALPAEHTVGTRSRLTFTEDTWVAFDSKTEHWRDTNMKRVGWYHSHPNFGIFLSPYDIDVCENFRLPMHVALVYDPIRHEGGFFVRGTEGFDPRKPCGFWEHCDERHSQASVTWNNVELVWGKERTLVSRDETPAVVTVVGAKKDEEPAGGDEVSPVAAALPVQEDKADDAHTDEAHVSAEPSFTTQQDSAALSREGEALAPDGGVAYWLRAGVSWGLGGIKRITSNAVRDRREKSEQATGGAAIPANPLDPSSTSEDGRAVVDDQLKAGEAHAHGEKAAAVAQPISAAETRNPATEQEPAGEPPHETTTESSPQSSSTPDSSSPSDQESTSHIKVLPPQ